MKKWGSLEFGSARGNEIHTMKLSRIYTTQDQQLQICRVPFLQSDGSWVIILLNDEQNYQSFVLIIIMEEQ